MPRKLDFEKPISVAGVANGISKSLRLSNAIASVLGDPRFRSDASTSPPDLANVTALMRGFMGGGTAPERGVARLFGKLGRKDDRG